MTNNRQGVAEGMPVYSADGVRMGKVVACGASKFEIEKGFFFPKDFLIPYEDVSAVEDSEVFVRLTKHELEQSWARADLVGEDASHPPPYEFPEANHGYRRNAAEATPNRADERLNTGAVMEEDEPVTPGDDEHPTLFEGRREVDDYLF